MALFLTIAIGYLVGEINVKGFSLGVGAVLFVALGMGWFAPKSVPAPMVGTLSERGLYTNCCEPSAFVWRRGTSSDRLTKPMFPSTRV